MVFGNPWIKRGKDYYKIIELSRTSVVLAEIKCTPIGSQETWKRFKEHLKLYGNFKSFYKIEFYLKKPLTHKIM